jgi:hypothetical protein
MNEELVMVLGLFVLSVVSGMLGLGVAFAAVKRPIPRTCGSPTSARSATCRTVSSGP